MPPEKEVQSDLAELAHIAEQISETSDSIAAAIQRIDGAIGELGKRVGTQCAIDIPEEHLADCKPFSVLAVTKDSRGWGLYLGKEELYEEDHVSLLAYTPITETSLGCRMALSVLILELIRQYRSQAEEKLSDLRGPASLLRGIAESLEEAFPEPGNSDSPLDWEP